MDNEEGQAMLEKAIDIPELTPKILRGVVHSKAQTEVTCMSTSKKFKRKYQWLFQENLRIIYFLERMLT